MWSWRVLPAVFWKLALQQTAQQVGHGHALREGRHLDACPHGSRDVEGQASGVDVALVERIRVALANPRLGVWISGRTRTDANPLGWAFAVGWIAAGAHDEIGRAACRERGGQTVDSAVAAVTLKKKTK